MINYKLCACGVKIASHLRACAGCLQGILKAKKQDKARADKRYNALKRDKQSDKFYHSQQWLKLRAKFLSEQPFCVRCSRFGVIIDHITPIKDGGAKLDENNLQTLCRSCHNQKTSEERKGAKS